MFMELQALPPANQEHNDDFDYNRIENAIVQYQQILNTFQCMLQETIFEMDHRVFIWTWRNVLKQEILAPAKDMILAEHVELELLLVTLCFAFIQCMQAEQLMNSPQLSGPSLNKAKEVCNVPTLFHLFLHKQFVLHNVI